VCAAALTCTKSGTANINIKDNNPVGVSDTIDVPDFGTAQAVTVAIDLANSDVSTVTVTLFDPAGGQYTLYDKGNKGAGLVATYPTPDKPVAGDLGGWVGKNPKGKWTLQVVDISFLNNKTDGQIKTWSIAVKSASCQ
jgi:subtilisin-like proprotein convertase family protein